MKAIFLDIDGVLNTEKTANIPLIPVNFDTGLPFRRLGYHAFDEMAVKRLNRLTDETGAKIIISSTWRIGALKQNNWDRLKAYFGQMGVTGEIVDFVPYRPEEISRHLGETPKHQTRGVEIKVSLLQHPEIDKFVIIDDDDDMDGLEEFLVQTTWEEGLQDEHVKRAIEILE
jgi:hypothetical protein